LGVVAWPLIKVSGSLMTKVFRMTLQVGSVTTIISFTG
jgi:hypothetical protein